MTRPGLRLFAAGLLIVAAAAGLLFTSTGGPARTGPYVDRFPPAPTNSSGDVIAVWQNAAPLRRETRGTLGAWLDGEADPLIDRTIDCPPSACGNTLPSALNGGSRTSSRIFTALGPPSGVSSTDTATIQNAINAGYGGNAPIRLGAGTWQVCGGLTISSPLLVFEASNPNDYPETAVLDHNQPKTIITCTAGPTAPYITISAAYGITIRGIAFYGNASHPCVALLNSHSVTLDGDGFFSCVNGVDDSSNDGSASSEELTIKNSVFSEGSNCGDSFDLGGTISTCSHAPTAISNLPAKPGFVPAKRSIRLPG
jgi:hypothetical protein